MIKTVLFDLDGTMINTNELIIATFIHVMNQNFPEKQMTRQQIIPSMGLTLEEQLRILSGREDVTSLIQDYRTYNRAHHDEMVLEFPHVIEVIDTLYKQGVTIGVVTTKLRSSATRTLEAFNLMDYMSTIVTVDEVEHPKPHPEPVLTAIERLKADPESTIMIGDSPADIIAARAAGVKSAGVAWSLKGAEVLRTYGPDYIFEDMRDIYDVMGLEYVK